MGFFTALQFLTIFPGLKRQGTSAEDFGQSLAYFPLVGLLLGAILLGLNYGLSYILPGLVVDALVIIALAILTGAHHIDGFIDTFDGIVGGKSREQKLEIMSDSRVGAFGITAAILMLLLKYVSLYSAPAVLPALVLMPTLSRWITVNSIFIFPYAKSSGMGLAFKQGANWQRVTIATAITLLISILVMSWKGLVLMAALWIVVFIIAGYFRSRLGGLTGDNYGAINEIAEAFVLVLLILIIQRL